MRRGVELQAEGVDAHAAELLKARAEILGASLLQDLPRAISLGRYELYDGYRLSQAIDRHGRVEHDPMPNERVVARGGVDELPIGLAPSAFTRQRDLAAQEPDRAEFFVPGWTITFDDGDRGAVFQRRPDLPEVEALVGTGIVVEEDPSSRVG